MSFIIEAIYCRAAKKPAFKAVEKEVVRNLEWFSAKPIKRKWVLYEIDRKYATQSERQYQHELNKGSVDATKYKGPIPRLKAMELSKVDKKLEFAESDIGYKNDHAATKGVLPGMFVFSCVHLVSLGKPLNCFTISAGILEYNHIHLYPTWNYGI